MRVLTNLQFHTISKLIRLSSLCASFFVGLVFIQCLDEKADAQAWTTAAVAATQQTSQSFTWVSQPSASKPPFYIRSYEGLPHNVPANDILEGKCLDYGIPPGASTSAILSVFLNACNVAHAIVVEELNNGRHEIILHAGGKIIGIRRPVVFTISNPILSAPVTVQTNLQVAAASTSQITTSTATKEISPATAAALWWTNEYPLQLFGPNEIITPGVSFVFALDGDSIILANSRCTNTTPPACNPPPTQLVVQLRKSRSDIGTPLVVRSRNLADSEFWDFVAADSSDQDPTSGFVRVSDKTSLLAAISQIQQVAKQNDGAAWGSVIRVIDDGQAIDLTDTPAGVDPSDNSLRNLTVPTGVTVRGDRRGANAGPLLIGRYNEQAPDPGNRLLQIEGDYVRVTGLRVQGPSGNEEILPDSTGIFIGDPLVHAHQPIQTIVDHNEVFNWPTAGVQASASSDDIDCNNGKPGTFDPISKTFTIGAIGSLDATNIQRNFIHDNAERGLGYGVVISEGAGATIFGNTFLYNRHDVAADGRTGDQYSAWDNLVLSQAPVYCGTVVCKAEQDFDMHGTQDLQDQQHDGGFAGYNVEIAWNSFLGGGKPNFTLRGQPCKAPDSFRNNVLGQGIDESIYQWDYWGNKSTPDSSTGELTIKNNYPNASDPTNHMAVGDFDGDGREDLFLATGTTWFYSPGGVAEWRFLNAGKTDKFQSLLFGDFNSDGRTDVVGINGSHLMVSWSGASDWEIINSVPQGASITDMATGDFDGDGHSDIFYADGSNWYVAYGGSGPFTFVNTSSWRVNKVRFGHFSICGNRGETDVFGIVTGKWQVTCGALQDWIPLPVSLTNSLFDLYVADFDGDGNADIAQAWALTHDSTGRLIRWQWLFSNDASEGWTSHTVTPTNSCPELGPQINASLRPYVAAVGRFGGNIGSDVLIWGGNDSWGNELCILPGGTGAAMLESRQQMR